MNRIYKILIALGSGISAFLVIIGVTMRNSMHSTISNLTNQETVLNQTALSFGQKWVKLYGYYSASNNFSGLGSLTNLGFAANKTLSSQLNALQTQISNAQSVQSSPLGMNLILAGVIGFIIVGLSVLCGYAIHKHIVDLINKSQVKGAS